MLHQIEGNNADELFKRIAVELLDKGKYSYPRGLKTIELENVWLQLNNIKDCIVKLPERKINLEYLAAELDWYKSGDYNINKISEFSSFWKRIADENGNINSNYGAITFTEKNQGLSQYDWCVRKLTEDPESRQAVINYNQPKHKYQGNKDFVCTLNQLFRIESVEENYPDIPSRKLNSTVFMRSNDLIYGLTYDLPWFCSVQEKMANELECDLGKYFHFAASLHVYERHFNMLKNIANSK